MIHNVDLSPAAETDLVDAYRYYEDQADGLGEQFVLLVEKHLDQIMANPRQYQSVHLGVRRAVMRRFPYAIFYLAEDDQLVVLAITHQARHPETWLKRFPQRD